MYVLGIETSCDETAAAIVADGTVVHANVVATQHALHEQFGGVVPEIASRAHVEQIQPVIEQCLQEAGITLQDVGAIAVGNRPGLIGSLIVGVSAAQALAWSLNKPLIGVDHVEAHLHAPWLRAKDTDNTAYPKYPALGLVVSGGHTSLYALHGAGDMTRLGGTIDDAAGEAFDKAAVILNLGYPGGPAIDRAAQRGDCKAYKFPRSLLDADSLDFSFSGLKTSLLYTVRGQPHGRGSQTTFERDISHYTASQRDDLAASFQAAVVDTLIIKIERAMQRMADESQAVQQLIVGGGVSANTALRHALEQCAKQHDIALHIPAMAYCVDNAAMIAGLGWHKLQSDGPDPLDLPVVATTSC